MENNLLKYAQKFIDLGYQAFPTKEKAPYNSFMWKTQKAKLNDFEGTDQVAIAMGDDNDFLCIDIDIYKTDDKKILTEILNEDLVTFLHKNKLLYAETTKSQGFHFIVKTKQKLSSKKITKVKTSENKYECIIETKGVNGYVVVYPSFGYENKCNFNLWDLGYISDEELEGLFDILKSYNQEAVEASIPLINNSIFEGKKVWDYYNEEQSSIDYSKRLLEQNGWKIKGKNLIRPGKTEGTSATFGHVANNVFYVFSTSCHPFEEGKAYKPFNILTLLEFNGDYKESTKYLAKIYKNETSVALSEPIDKQKDLLKDCFVDFRKDVVLPPSIISFIENYRTPSEKNIGVLTLGDISVITGMQKAKKTFFLNKIVQSYLENGKVIDERIVSEVPKNKEKVCIIDTEQSEYWANLNAKRINKISNSDNFDYLGLRKFNAKERKEKIELYLNCYGKNLGLLIIDGIVDLCFNSNDMNESIEIVNWLMKESAERQIHIICALHLNPGLSNNGETKMRGFLGTILAQKAESVIQIEKEKQNESQSKISAKDVRGRSFKPFCIEINEDGIPYFVSYGSRIEQNEYSKINDSPF
jgi:hypothetical protein